MSEDYIYISALNHYEYCPTRCYWIYVAGEFQDNEYTVEGDIIHENVHKTMKTTRGDLVQLRRVHVYSKKYGLIGFADLIEEKAGEIYPVEYKRGRRGDWRNDKLQLCAQALCIEEMLSSSTGEPSLVVSRSSLDEKSLVFSRWSFDKKNLKTKDEGPRTRITKGFIYYASSGRRVEVILDDELRKYTVEMIEKVRELMKSGVKPPAFYQGKCTGCSLYPVCLPKEEEKARRVKLDFGL
jgi:CRISPR-associated exonuclease Cas4